MIMITMARRSLILILASAPLSNSFHVWSVAKSSTQLSCFHHFLLGRTDIPLRRHRWTFLLAASNPEEQGSGADEQGGADLAAEFFKLAQAKGIALNSNDVLDDEDDEDEEDDGGAGDDVGVASARTRSADDEDDDDDEDDEEEFNIPQGAINAFLGYDTGNVGEKLAGNVTLTDNELYSAVKERVLDTAGGFVQLVGGAKEEEDEEDDEEEMIEDELSLQADKPKPYEPPATIPDSELTAGEVVLLVLEALLHNNVPSKNRGVEILFGYSSPGSQIKNEVGLTPEEYAEFLQETEYKVLFDHKGASIDKGDYSFDGKRAFFTARLQVGESPLDIVSVNFILSSHGVDDDACWMVDSLLIRPQAMRRRRRR